MNYCQYSIKSTLKRAKHQIQKAVNPERVIKIPETREWQDQKLYGYLGQEYPDSTEGTGMPKLGHEHILGGDLYVMGYAGLI